MNLTVKDLLERGFFPQELPPPFNTTSLAAAYAAKKLPFKTTKKEAPSSKPEIYSLARTGTLRRELSILNPVHFTLLAECVAKNWRELRKQSSKSKFTLTKPTLTEDGRAIAREYNLDIRAGKRAELRSCNRFLLLGDISRFYPSIYTHSIPWALHGKSMAKANRGSGLIGNELDMLVRNCQDGQTMGIPIGPDTSLLIAEILLSKVDGLLSRKRIKGIRYIDDYELAFDSEAEAVKAQTILERALLEYELHLNPAKTKILPLPQQIQDTWVTELKDLELSPLSHRFQSQVVRFFDHAFELARQFPTENVLRYAAGRIGKIEDMGKHYELVEDLLIQCARVEAGALPFLIKSIVRSTVPPAKRAKQRQDLLYRLILEHSPQRHSSEVAWSLWACIALGLKIAQKVVKPVLEMEDSVCALLLLHAKSEQLVTTNVSLDVLKSFMRSDELYDRHWLLAYEANVHKWLPSSGSADHVSSNHNFSLLKAAGVSFYDQSKTILPDPTDAVATSPILSRLQVDYDEEETQDV